MASQTMRKRQGSESPEKKGATKARKPKNSDVKTKTRWNSILLTFGMFLLVVVGVVGYVRQTKGDVKSSIRSLLSLGGGSKGAKESGVLGSFSVIIPIRDEDEYIHKTLNYFMTDGNPAYIDEFIIFDDASKRPVSSWLYDEIPASVHPLITIIRSEEPVGLINGRLQGAAKAKSENLFFLDGHCRPVTYNWGDALLVSLAENNKRAAVPIIAALDKVNWQAEVAGHGGTKMMFDWTFEFYWQVENTPYIPIMAGGIYAIKRDYFIDSGAYDPGMLEWGGENIEQSIRMWTCGGEIVSITGSIVGHIFDRPPKPNEGNKLVERVQLNHLRLARVWLDKYQKYFFKHHHSCRNFYHRLKNKPADPENELSERRTLRKDNQCKPFSWFINRFRSSFDRHGLIESDYHFLVEDESNKCLTINRGKPVHVSLQECRKNKNPDELLDQSWINYNGKRTLKPRNLIARNQLFIIHAPAMNSASATKSGKKVGFTLSETVDEWIINESRRPTPRIGVVYVDTERHQIGPDEVYKSTPRSDGETGLIMSWLSEVATLDANDDLPGPPESEKLKCLVLVNDEIQWGDCSNGLHFTWK